MTHHIVFLDYEGIGPAVTINRPAFTHTWTNHAYTAPDQVVERLQDATIAVTCSLPLRQEQLAQLPHLQMISMALTGVDIVDMAYCQERGIRVANVPGYAENTVAEHTLSMIFALLRRTGNYHQLMRDIHDGKAALQNLYLNYRVRDVRGLQLGIIGNGPIAHRLKHIARGVGMHAFLHDRQGTYQGADYIPLTQLLKTSDVVAICCPLTSETYHLIDTPELAMMKKDALLVNTGRGGVINEPAMISALLEQRLGGVALDVVENEPIQLDDPIFQLIHHPNFMLTPHVAWSSENAMQTLMDRAIANIVEFVGSENNVQMES
ncbi:NAD(P)-dependent oxidoreductase [Paenalcaligenes suwonensis]|uniref:NAD(P)-dependent oxidoreductase n=1 Tax=Paenalcaligenes suwonensis TaxID=1202713 RepID=UPI00140D64DB|nr:NAD(P)-dependent oxidoreductase [Paenalcaligenes suwonensis]NHC62419.1 D-2-hydroxyacid dehydrogenase [Paenalcaligenes suwonensis]